MTDPVQAFPVIVNPATNEGEYVGRRQEGQAGAGINGLIGFSFKDQSGNVVLPTLTAEGKLPVDLQGAGTALKSRDLLGGTATLTEVTSITLTNDAVYRDVTFVVSCRRDAMFQVITEDNGADTIVYDAMVGPGQYTFTMRDQNFEHTAGSTGTQKIKIMGQNIGSGSGALSDMRASISIVEQVAGA